MKPSLTKLKSAIIFSSFLLLANNFVEAQTLAQRLQEARDNLRRAKQTIAEANGVIVMTKSLIYSAGIFKKVSEMNTQEFNKNVKVVKADTGKYNPAITIPHRDITQPKIVNGQFTNLNWNPVVYFDGSLFPSAIIAMASYKKEFPDDDQSDKAIQRPIGFHIVSDKSFIPLKYEVECVDKSFFDKVSGNILYKNGKQFYDFNIPIPWNFKTLVNTTTPTIISVHFRLYDENGNVVDKPETITVRSINDCVSQYKQTNLQFMFAAYIQEEDPKLDEILRDALHTKIVTAFVGYQRDAIEVDKQVLAIWRVLHEQGFAYSSITTTSIEQDNVSSQTVRTCENALKAKQANCVDGTVLFASILRKIGIDPILITCNEFNTKGALTGGHCFLAYAIEPSIAWQITDEKGLNDHIRSFHFLETTMLSTEEIKNGKVKENVNASKTIIAKNKIYKDIFDWASFYGFLEYTNQVQSKLGYDQIIKIDQVISVSNCRDKIGSIPIYNQ